MLDILPVIIAFVLGGACLGFTERSVVRGELRRLPSLLAWRQTYGARRFQFVGEGSTQGSIRSCRHMAVAAALARPAPRRIPAPLDGWSSGVCQR